MFSWLSADIIIKIGTEVQASLGSRQVLVDHTRTSTTLRRCVQEQCVQGIIVGGRKDMSVVMGKRLEFHMIYIFSNSHHIQPNIARQEMPALLYSFMSLCGHPVRYEDYLLGRRARSHTRQWILK